MSSFARNDNEARRAGVSALGARQFDATEREMVARWRGLRASWSSIAKMLGASTDAVRREFDPAYGRPAINKAETSWTPRTRQQEMLAHLRRAPGRRQALSFALNWEPQDTTTELTKLKRLGLASNTTAGTWNLTGSGLAHLEALERAAMTSVQP